jgi:uncharacterized protein
MQCPLCNIELNMISLKGIEADDCPKCRGIWLDRGELDRLIDRSPVISADQLTVEWITEPPAFSRGFHGYPRARRYGHNRNKSLTHEYVDLC